VEKRSLDLTWEIWENPRKGVSEDSRYKNSNALTHESSLKMWTYKSLQILDKSGWGRKFHRSGIFIAYRIKLGEVKCWLKVWTLHRHAVCRSVQGTKHSSYEESGPLVNAIILVPLFIGTNNMWKLFDAIHSRGEILHLWIHLAQEMKRNDVRHFSSVISAAIDLHRQNT
jgi:hypothetical protein